VVITRTDTGHAHIDIHTEITLND